MEILCYLCITNMHVMFVFVQIFYTLCSVGMRCWIYLIPFVSQTASVFLAASLVYLLPMAVCLLIWLSFGGTNSSKSLSSYVIKSLGQAIVSHGVNKPRGEFWLAASTLHAVPFSVVTWVVVSPHLSRYSCWFCDKYLISTSPPLQHLPCL